MSSFAHTRKGRALAEKLNKEYHRRLEEEYLKKCIDGNNPLYADWPTEKIQMYNREIKRLIENRLRDELFG